MFLPKSVKYQPVKFIIQTTWELTLILRFKNVAWQIMYYLKYYLCYREFYIPMWVVETCWILCGRASSWTLMALRQRKLQFLNQKILLTFPLKHNVKTQNLHDIIIKSQHYLCRIEHFITLWAPQSIGRSTVLYWGCSGSLSWCQNLCK